MAKVLHVSVLFTLTHVGCAGGGRARHADDSGIAWRASPNGRDITSARRLPGRGTHASGTDAALLFGADAGLEQPTPEGALAITAIEGGNGGQARRTLQAPTRPSGTSATVDFASIPLMSERALDPSDEGATFHLAPRTRDVPCRPPNPPLVELSWPGDFREPSILRIGGAAPPSVVLQRDDPSVERPPVPNALAEWLLLDDAGRSRETASVTTFEGRYVDATGEGRARASATVVARALVPGLLYTYRRCVEGCTQSDTKGHREEVSLIGPPAIWIGSSGASPASPSSSSTQDLSEVTAPIEPGGSATMLIIATPASIAKFRRPSSEAGVEPLLRTFSLEIVWQRGEAPDATLFTGTLDEIPTNVDAVRLDSRQGCR